MPAPRYYERERESTTNTHSAPLTHTFKTKRIYNNNKMHTQKKNAAEIKRGQADTVTFAGIKEDKEQLRILSI